MALSKDELSEAAKNPKRVQGDEGSVEQHSLNDQIALDKHLNSGEAVKSKTRGLILNRLRPPSAVNE